MNMFDYVKQYGKYSFEEEPFNEVDNVIFSQIPYLPLNGVVSGFGHRSITLAKAARLLERELKKKRSILPARFYKKIYRLLFLMKDMPRYKDVLLYNYIRIVDHDRQFGAITIKLTDGTVYVSYEGTDCAISGWYEDARMTYSFPVPAQELAANYLRRTIRFLDKNVIVGGHSKGGNLAIYAALEAPFYIKHKILKVYNNDGPGFFKELFDSKAYQKLLPKIVKIVPRESVVGMFLYQSEDLEIVKSKSKRILQHDPFNWQILGKNFERDYLSDFSHNVSNKTNLWLAKLSKEEKEQCLTKLFAAFESSNIEETNQLYSISKTKNFIKNLYHIDSESKENLVDVFKEMIW